MDAQEVKAECRLYAVEWFLAQLWALQLRQSGDAVALLSEIRLQATQAARKKTFRDQDAAMSDLISAELESAIDRILRMIEALLGPNSRL